MRVEQPLDRRTIEHAHPLMLAAAPASVNQAKTPGVSITGRPAFAVGCLVIASRGRGISGFDYSPRNTGVRFSSNARMPSV